MGHGAAAQERMPAAEERQVRLLERLSHTVAAVFPGEPGAGGGSGVIIDPRGYVLTNFHVSGVKRRLWVGLDDGTIHPAVLLGIDPGGDVALLKLVDPERSEYPAAPLGDSDALRLGEPVYALGNPFLLAEDFRPTITQGVVSGIHRYRDGTGSAELLYGDCVQTDASINPGNSGGPLFDGRGRLVGINGLGGFRPDRGRVNVGVGFAASIEQIKNFLYDLRACRQCYHGTLNATVRDVTGADGRPAGVVVDAVVRGSNAERAGLRLGDRVLSFEGERIRSQNHFLTLLTRLPARRRVRLRVARTVEGEVEPRELEFVFRLQPLWAGPIQGEWRPDPRLVAAETRSLLAEIRASRPPDQWVREEQVLLPDGRRLRRVVRARGPWLRVEVGAPGAETVEVVAGDLAWRRDAKGALGPLPPERRDELAGTAEALHGLRSSEGENRLTRLEFTGGDRVAGERVWRIEARDRAGRRRLLYVSPASKRLVGYAYPTPEGRWVEVEWISSDGRPRRLDADSGEVLETCSEVVVRAEPQPASLFERPE